MRDSILEFLKVASKKIRSQVDWNREMNDNDDAMQQGLFHMRLEKFREVSIFIFFEEKSNFDFLLEIL